MNCQGCRQRFLPFPDLSRKIEGDSCSQGNDDGDFGAHVKIRGVLLGN